MNKTAILSFILDEILLKARNVSSNMRKRIHWMLKYMQITVKEYDERVLVLNGWIRVGKEGVQISKVEEMKKGISNYNLKTKDQFKKVVTLNNEARFYKLDFNLTSLIKVESVEDLRIGPDNFYRYAKLSFNKAKFLSLHWLSTNQIKLILKIFKRIDKLEIYRSSLKTIDLTQSKIKEFNFANVLFKESVYLPKEIDKLKLFNCKFPNLIKAKRVNYIDFKCNSDPIEFFQMLEGVKEVRINNAIEEYFSSFPSTVRKLDITGSFCIIRNFKQIFSHFPYLIDINKQIPTAELIQSKLRVINLERRKFEKKPSLRPRKIKVSGINYPELKYNPELFEKVKNVYVETAEFNLDLIPSEIKKIEIYNEVDLDSFILNRLEKERG